MPYYPAQRIIAKMARIQREALLPEEAVGTVSVSEGQTVDIRQTVARGLIPARHIILETRATFGKLDDAALKRLLLVKERGQRISARDAILGRDAKRGKRLFAPVDGVVVYAGGERVIMQEMPQIINVEAGVRGVVTEVHTGRGVTIAASGAQVQGVWGNGRSLIALMRLEPPDGLLNLNLEGLETTYRNEIVVTLQPITADVLRVAEARSIGALVAPSMDASLIESVKTLSLAVMLTEGFGTARMNPAIAALLQEFVDTQVTLNAVEPRRWEPLRPEIVINRRSDEEPAPVDYNLTLKRGMRVRVNRAPYLGQTGRVIELPDQPTLLPNGLRAICARVELEMGAQTVYIPLNNLEFAGR